MGVNEFYKWVSILPKGLGLRIWNGPITN